MAMHSIECEHLRVVALELLAEIEERMHRAGLPDPAHRWRTFQCREIPRIGRVSRDGRMWRCQGYPHPREHSQTQTKSRAQGRHVDVLRKPAPKFNSTVASVTQLS